MKSNYKKAFLPVSKPIYKKTVPYKSTRSYKITPIQGLNKSNKLLEKIVELSTNKLADVIIGHVNNGINSVINNSKENLPYVEKEVNKNLLSGNVEDNTKVYYIKFHLGHTSSRSVSAAESQFGSAKLELTNSLSDAIGSSDRAFLTQSFGFNQKRIDFLGPKFYGIVSDYNQIYNIDKWNPEANAKDVPYGLVKQENTYLKIRNSNTYHAIHLKINLVKILDDDVDMWILYNKTFNDIYSMQEPGAIPSIYQIEDKQNKSNNYMYSVLCYPGTRADMSSNFKVHAKTVKSFSLITKYYFEIRNKVVDY